MTLNILVIHGYVQSAGTLASNSFPLKTRLADIANLHYVDGPPMYRNAPYSASRPWWILDNDLEHKMSSSHRWNDTVKWWSEQLSSNEYDGIIGLSQGAAMAALLLCMLKSPEKVPGFRPKKPQPLKFVIFCSGFISQYDPHGELYTAAPTNIPTLHTVDIQDGVVPAQKSLSLQTLFPGSQLIVHKLGHCIPVEGTCPTILREFILEACAQSNSQLCADGGMRGSGTIPTREANCTKLSSE